MKTKRDKKTLMQYDYYINSNKERGRNKRVAKLEEEKKEFLKLIEMRRTKQDYLGLLGETVEFYSKDPSRRATTNFGCMYITKDGRNCALGRCMNEESLDELAGSSMSAWDVNRNFNGIDNTLEEKYKGYKISFWTKLQTLHDDDNLWSDKGLTELGKSRVETITKLINNNKFYEYEN